MGDGENGWAAPTSVRPLLISKLQLIYILEFLLCGLMVRWPRTELFHSSQPLPPKIFKEVKTG